MPRIEGTNGGDNLVGTSVDDSIYALGDADFVDAGAGNDHVDLGDGDDLGFAGLGNDYVDAGNGNDYVDGVDGSDILHGGQGNDSLVGGYQLNYAGKRIIWTAPLINRSITFQPWVTCFLQIPYMNMCIDDPHTANQGFTIGCNPFVNLNSASISELCSPSTGAPASDNNNLLSTRIGQRVVFTVIPLLVFTFISISNIRYPSSFTSLSKSITSAHQTPALSKISNQ